MKIATSKFNSENPYKVQELENSGVPFNDSNLEEYLDELEAYTNKILLDRGKSLNQPNSELYAKTILLEQLAPKDFKKRAYVFCL